MITPGLLIKLISISLHLVSLRSIAVCRAERTSGEGAKFPRKARENEQQSREKNKFQVVPAPISSRFLCPRPPLLLSAPNQNRHAKQASI